MLTRPIRTPRDRAPTRAQEREALRILAGCPDGATLHALMANDVSGATIMALVHKRHVLAQLQRTTARFPVWRFWITQAGRDNLPAAL